MQRSNSSRDIWSTIYRSKIKSKDKHKDRLVRFGATLSEYNSFTSSKDIWKTNIITNTHTNTQIIYVRWKYRDKVLKKHKVILCCELSRRKSISATQYLFKLRRCPKRRAHCALSSSQNWKSWQQLIAANQIWAKFLLIVPFWNITTVNVIATNQIWDWQNFVH